jgi:hypothetical protein
VLDEAVDVALDYLEATDQAKVGGDTQCLVTDAVLRSWLPAVRHKMRLANEGIVAVQCAQVKLAKWDELSEPNSRGSYAGSMRGQ